MSRSLRVAAPAAEAAPADVGMIGIAAEELQAMPLLKQPPPPPVLIEDDDQRKRWVLLILYALGRLYGFTN